MIKCTQCLIEQSEDSFRLDNRKKNGKRSNCRKCELKADTRYKDDPEKQQKRTQSWREKQGKNLKYSYRKWSLKKNYGLTEEDYATMLIEQGGVCAICKTPPNKKQLAVDHCHSTGKIRKLLCANCNTALGLLKDNLKLIEEAKQYIKQHLEA